MNRHVGWALSIAGTLLLAGMLCALPSQQAVAQDPIDRLPAAGSELVTANKDVPPASMPSRTVVASKPITRRMGPVLLVLFVASANLALGFAVRIAWPSLENWLSDEPSVL